MDYREVRELYHFGILGMKWGVRRFQNEDGSLTPDGKVRYSKDGVYRYEHDEILKAKNTKDETKLAKKLWNYARKANDPGFGKSPLFLRKKQPFEISEKLSKDVEFQKWYAEQKSDNTTYQNKNINRRIGEWQKELNDTNSQMRKMYLDAFDKVGKDPRKINSIDLHDDLLWEGLSKSGNSDKFYELDKRQDFLHQAIRHDTSEYVSNLLRRAGHNPNRSVIFSYTSDRDQKRTTTVKDICTDAITRMDSYINDFMDD